MRFLLLFILFLVYHCQSKNITIIEILKLLELNPFILQKKDDKREEYLIEIQTREDKNREASIMIYFIINTENNTISLQPHLTSYSIGAKLCKELKNKTNFQNTLRSIIEKYQSHWDEVKNSPNTNELRLKFGRETPLEIDTESGSKNDSKPNKLILYNRDYAEGKFHFETMNLALDK